MDSVPAQNDPCTCVHVYMGGGSVFGRVGACVLKMALGDLGGWVTLAFPMLVEKFDESFA